MKNDFSSNSFIINKRMTSNLTGLDRQTTDAFYTAGHVALDCINSFIETIQPKKTDIIIEPSAGAGAFSLRLAESYQNVVAFDIDPRHPSIQQQNFLDYSFDVDDTKEAHVVGNPPFGRQSSLAKKFIQHASKFAVSISFILPKSFKKESMQKVFPLQFHLVKECEIPVNSFLINNKEHDVPCIFQIWKKFPTERQIQPPEEPLCFTFCKKEEDPDIALRRVGVNAGKVITTNLSSLSHQSHYFILKRNITKRVLEKLFKDLIFQHDNTVGPKSISKQELILQLNLLFKKQKNIL